MVELGIVLMREKVPYSLWKSMLDAHLVKKFVYEITNQTIELEEKDYFGNGLYSQLNQSYKHVYVTEAFSLETLKEAIKSFYEGKDKSATSK